MVDNFTANFDLSCVFVIMITERYKNWIIIFFSHFDTNCFLLFKAPFLTDLRQFFCFLRSLLCHDVLLYISRVVLFGC